MPALSAGLSGSTDGSVPPTVVTTAPSSTVRLCSCLTCGSMARNRIPIHGRDSVWPCRAWSMIGRAMSIGIANPMPLESVATAVLIPTTAPEASTSGPPELPGLIAASVWMRFEIRLPSSSVIVRPLPDTMPLVTENE